MVGMRQTAKVAIRYNDALLRQIIVIVSSKAFFVFREKSIHSKGFLLGWYDVQGDHKIPSPISHGRNAESQNQRCPTF